MQVPLKPKEIEPQLLHVFIFDLKELKNINTKSNKKRGIRNNRSKMFPRKLKKKLMPKIGTSNRKINEKVNKFLLALRK